MRGVGLVRNRVTDPYSISLNADSKRSWIGRLGGPALKPPGWDSTPHSWPARLAAAGPASSTQQAVVMAEAATDCFNWGYDPFHFNAPEGSLASDAEHLMMARLMIDSAVLWAREHRIDLIGEGWNFGEVRDGARFVQASPLSLAGSGIATFSDRVRDAVRGGGAQDSGPPARPVGTAPLARCSCLRARSWSAWNARGASRARGGQTAAASPARWPAVSAPGPASRRPSAGTPCHSTGNGPRPWWPRR